MGKINNKNLIKGIIDGLNIQLNQSAVPVEYAEKVVPTFETNTKLLRRCNIVKQGARTTNGSSTLYATPTDKDFYLCSFWLQNISSATADNVSISLLATIEGISTAIIYFNKPTLTLFQETLQVSVPFPIRLDRGTNVTISSTFTLGTSNTSAVIIGYTDDDLN